MAFKTILSVMGDGDGDDLRIATDLARDLGAHLSVLVLGIEASPPIGEFATMTSDLWLQEPEEVSRRLQASVEKTKAELARLAISADVESGSGEPALIDKLVGRRARYADLILIGPEMLANDMLKSRVIDGTLFSSGRPILLVPAGVKVNSSPKRILVAWDAKVEAARAAREALGLLIRADEVHLVMVDPNVDKHGAEPGADAAAYLARHGIKVTVDRLPSEGRSVAEVLNRHAVDTQADFLVMGAYSHSRMRELIFGGVTSSMLEKPSLPLFMAR
jgi:nucleotide-binding universal stress UspA family protein